MTDLAIGDLFLNLNITLIGSSMYSMMNICNTPMTDRDEVKQVNTWACIVTVNVQSETDYKCLSQFMGIYSRIFNTEKFLRRCRSIVLCRTHVVGTVYKMVKTTV